MKLDALLKNLPVLAVTGSKDVEVVGITCDSRQARAGTLFVAVPGEVQDGAAFIRESIERGAVAVVSEREESRGPGVTFIRVQDARAAVSQLACAFHHTPSAQLKIVAITGTNGKTTTSYVCRDALRAAGLRPGLIGTVEYEIGSRVIPASRTTPDPCLLQSILAQMVGAGCRSAVMEVSSHSLVQKRVLGIEFDVAVFTNLTRDHLDYHRDMERYFEAKVLLFTGLRNQRKSAVAAINIDDPWGRRLAALPGLPESRVTYGMDPGAAVRAVDIELKSEGSLFRVVSPWGDAVIRTRLLGRYNISNALAAIAAAGSLGIGPEVLAKVLSGMTHVPGRLEEIDTRKDFQVFVDYAHTDDALSHVLETLREVTQGRLILVFGCGGNRDRTKRPVMGSVADRLADYSILTSDNPRKEAPADIIREIESGFGSARNHEIIEDRGEAIRRALALAGRGDVVLIAGKGHENFQEFANTTIPFDDRQVVRKLLSAP